MNWFKSIINPQAAFLPNKVTTNSFNRTIESCWPFLKIFFCSQLNSDFYPTVPCSVGFLNNISQKRPFHIPIPWLLYRASKSVVLNTNDNKKDWDIWEKRKRKKAFVLFFQSPSKITWNYFESTSENGLCCNFVSQRMFAMLYFGCVSESPNLSKIHHLCIHLLCFQSTYVGYWTMDEQLSLKIKRDKYDYATSHKEQLKYSLYTQLKKQSHKSY